MGGDHDGSSNATVDPSTTAAATTDPLAEGLRILPNCVIVADLHLTGAAEPRQQFAELLERAHERSDYLFILGDLFHYWFGRRHVEHAMYADEIRLLREATERGLRIEIVPGNRDFLLGPTFAEATGSVICGDELALRVGNDVVHLSHGDLFGTSDVRYLRMRRVLRTRAVRFLADHLPTFALDRIARRLRQHSEKVVKEKAAWVLEPDRREVATLFQRGYDSVVCGHFHRERDESFPPNEGGGRFLVLDPFERAGRGLFHDGSQWSVVTFAGRGE